MKIVVIGGSGRVGSNVVRRLTEHGHDAVPASPATGVDTITGEGLAGVMAGADVGADRLPDSGYLRAKVAQEAEIEAGTIPHTILRATQFFEFLPQIVESGAKDDHVELPTGLMQFVAADDVAATVTELATGAPVGGVVELGGPEALGLDAWARRLFAMTGDDRPVVGDAHARYYGTELHGSELIPGPGARIGKIDFDVWLVTEGQGSAR